MKGPLSGVRVLDLTQMLAGPFCTMLLADMGAYVIKIEPRDGDLTRKEGPFSADDELKAYGGYFQSVNRGKRSLALDLKDPRGKDIARRLAGTCDVVVENFRPGVMDRLGLSYESLCEENPALVYACLRGFGDPRTGESPYADWPAFDVVAQAMAGFMSVTGPNRDEPLKAGPGVGDLFPAVLAALGVVSALRHADLTGEGQFVDVAMYDGILSLCERIIYLYSYEGTISEPQGNSHPLFCPFDVFPAQDGHVAIAAPRDEQWRELCRLLQLSDVGDDPRFSTNTLRSRSAHEVRRIVTDRTSKFSVKQLVELLGGNVPIGPVQTAAEIFADPHVGARALLAEVEQPGSQKPVSIVANPIKFTATPTVKPERAPLLSEHAVEILRQIGMDDSDVGSLQHEKVIV